MVTGEIRVDDVLVFFWRVLGETDRAVCANLEPLRVLLEPRMVERALHGKVERHFHAMLATHGYQPVEIGDRAELRFDSIMTAVFIPDCVKAAGVARRRFERIVSACSV